MVSKIKAIIQKYYNIEVKNIAKINRGSAQLYEINNQEYVLKVFQPMYSQEDILKEVKIIKHLKKDTIPVPEYVMTINNDYCIEYERNILTLQKYVKGYTLEANKGHYEEMIESANILGQIVKSLKTLDINLALEEDWCTKENLAESIINHEKLLNMAINQKEEKIVADLNDKISILKDLQENFLKPNGLTILNTHGDYSVHQFIYDNGKVCAVLDFVTACKMPIIWEIIRSYSYIDEECIDGKININNLIAYTNEFGQYIKLTKNDLIYMPYIYLVQLATSSFGYLEYLNDNEKTNLRDFAYFRTNLCRFLKENMKHIINELLNSIDYN